MNFTRYGTFAHIFEGKPESKRYEWTIAHVKAILKSEVYDNYFELGGDSLLATQLNAEINKKFNINLSLEKIFSNPIFAEQAISIASMLEDLCAGEIL